jgi:hypothetical protein
LQSHDSAWSHDAAKSPWVDQEVRAFAGLKIFTTLDNSTIPYYDNIVKIHCRETIGTLKRTGLRKTQQLFFEDHPMEEIIKLRSTKMKEWKMRLYVMNSKNKMRFERISEEEWLATDGTVLKPTSTLDRSNKRGDKITLLSTVPVTNHLYSQFLSETNWPEPSVWETEVFRRSEHPVVGVTWYEAKTCANWLGGSLPTILEWESSASCFEKHRIFATNDNSLSNDNGLCLTIFAEENPVNPKVYPPNPYGYYGMSGNTWDWCESRQGLYYIIKGGGFMDSPKFCEITAGYRNLPIV